VAEPAFAVEVGGVLDVFAVGVGRGERVWAGSALPAASAEDGRSGAAVFGWSGDDGGVVGDVNHWGSPVSGGWFGSEGVPAELLGSWGRSGSPWTRARRPACRSR